MVDEITVSDPALFAEPYMMVQSYTLEPDWKSRVRLPGEPPRRRRRAGPAVDGPREGDPFGEPEN